jgi:hypothetical protein
MTTARGGFTNTALAISVMLFGLCSAELLGAALAGAVFVMNRRLVFF